MNVLVVTNAYPSPEKPYAGIFVRNQYEWLLDSRGSFNVEIFSLTRTFTGAFGGIAKYGASFARFIPILFRRYDVVHLHFFFPMIIYVSVYRLFHPRTRIMVTFHGSDVHGRFNSRIGRAIFRYLAQQSDYNQAVGREFAKEVADRLDIKVHGILPAGVDQRIFFPARKEVEYDFTFVGSLIWRKGVDLVIEAIKSIDQGTFRFCFVGSGPFEEQVLDLTRCHQVRLLKNLPQAEIAEVLNKSRYLLFPTRYEPFGLVVTESMFCGTPPVTTRIGGMIDQVVPEFNGLFLEDCSVESTADVIIRAASLDERDWRWLSQNAMASNKQFSLASVCAKNVQIYNDLACRI